ncbi:SF1B family DNA helicase RecD2 [Amedibacillus sp. YH-ame6]
MNESLVLKAKHLLTIFRNDQSGYSVAKFVTYDANEEDFVATGYFRELHEDVIYELHGEYIDHPRYGMQFQVSAYEKMKPNDETSLIRYFSSSLFPGIGKQTAAMIVQILGDDAITKIKENPEVLIDIPSLNQKKIESILHSVNDHENLDDSIVFFTQHGISVKNIMKLEATYGERAASIVKENPYRLIEEVDGIGFKTADKLAKELSFASDHPYRMKAAVLACILDICMANGDTYTSEDALSKRLRKEFDVEIVLDDYLNELQKERLVMIEDGRIYHHTQYDAEKGIANFLYHFPYVEDISFDSSMNEEITELEERYHIHYEAKQKQAMTAFFKDSFSIITGGPGTGKTTIVQGILALCRTFLPTQRVALCAPTGRASKRLSELSNGSAMTLHSLLKWDLETNTFQANEKEPIDYDILIIDEFSMVDQWLFYNLVKASKNVRKILLIGDEDQLPSVGPGCVLKDLIESKQFSLSRLDKIFRQSEGSGVVRLAHEIRDGHIEVMNNTGDIAFFNAQNYEIKDLVMNIVSNAFEKGYQEKDIQVLAPMYRGVAGIDALNNALQKMINPPRGHVQEIKVGYRTFRENDKILQLKNQPDDGVFNGDIGTILEIIPSYEDIHHTNRITADFDGVIVEYAGEQIYHITHAYCVSIHKSQGSEYPIVILPIVSDYRHMLQKRLIYTAVTRAKKSLVMLGDPSVFERAIQIEDRQVRKSTLRQRILEFFG